MEDRKRFQNQKLNSEDYEKTEEGAKLLKRFGGLFAAFALLGRALKKYCPEIIKSIRVLIKH